MLPGNNFSMIVLAGGNSSRMGTDKADLCLLGKTFLQIQIEKGRRLGIEDILISGYRGTKCDLPVTEDRIPGKGPLGGLESCLRIAKREKCLVISVDVPLVPVSELENLLKASSHIGAGAVILKHGQKEQPLIGIYHRNLADAMLKEITEFRGSVFSFLNKTGYCVYESGVDGKYFANINSPEEYETVSECASRLIL